MKKLTENPLKGHTNEELLKFFTELEELNTQHYNMTENNFSCQYEGLLTREGMGLVRAFYICMIKFYKDHGIEIPKDIELDIPAKYQADYYAFASNLDEDAEWDGSADEILYSQCTGDGLQIINDIIDMSKVDGIGDFEAVNSAEGYGGYIHPEEVLATVYGEEWENIVAEDTELTEEEEKELPLPSELGMLLSEAGNDLDSGYINTIIDIRVIKSKKVGAVIEKSKVPEGMKRDDYLALEPLIEKFFYALDCLNEMQQYYLSSYNNDIVKDGIWYSVTVCADCCDSVRLVTVFSRLPSLLGMAWFVQEVADRMLDGRIRFPEVKTNAK